MNLIKINDTTSVEFNEALKILNYSFPKDEKPTKKQIIKSIKNGESQFFIAKKEQTVIGFFTNYLIINYHFIGNLAISKNYRGQGFGSMIMQQFMKGKNIVLEVERPTNEETKQRIHFYKKLGLYLNKFNYIMPNIQPNTQMLELYLMTTSPLTKIEFEKLRDIIHLQIYKTKPIYKID
jgi:ribosomal protein S18 acetylase RimI-like enzyme